MPGNGPLPSADVAIGFLLIGPNQSYPRHRHPAGEIYHPLAGRAKWQRRDDPSRCRPVGQAIFHQPNEDHAMTTLDEPMSALYCWAGALDVTARLSLRP